MGLGSLIGSAVSNVAGIVGSIGGVVSGYANEPLRRMENKRQQANADAEVEREIKRQTGVERARMETEVERETRIAKLNQEISEEIKNSDMARKKELAAAFMEFQEKQAKLQQNTVHMIAGLSTELRKDAYALVADKQKSYQDMQDNSMDRLLANQERIDTTFANNPKSAEMLSRMNERTYEEMLQRASAFMDSVNDDFERYTKTIDTLTLNAQNFVQDSAQRIAAIDSQQEDARIDVTPVQKNIGYQD